MERRDGEPSASETRSDLELIAAINGGDSEAFAVLYDRYRDWVVRQACYFTGNPDLALDVLQETFLYFLKKFPGFELTAQLKTFLYPAVRNLAIAARRKADRFQSQPEDAARAQTAVGSPPPSEAGSILADVLALLPEDHREVLRLRYLDGLKLNEIAVAMNLPTGTVKSRLHYALATLRQDPRTKFFFES